MKQTNAREAVRQTTRLPVRLLVPLIGLGTLASCGGSSSDNPFSTQETAGQISVEENLQGEDSGQSADTVSDSSDGSDTGNQNSNEQIDNEADALVSPVRLPSGGHLSNPEFQWPATEGAGSYRLVIEDHRGDHISQQLTSQQAGCLDTTVTCRFTPSVQIHDSILVWRTESFDASGDLIETSEDVSFNTLRSLTAQPFTSLDNVNAPPNPGHGFPTIEFDQFVVLNNDWNARAVDSDEWLQTVGVDRLPDGNAQIVFEYDWLTQNDGDEFAVKSYPQVVYGNKLGAHVSGTPEELGVPVTVANMGEFKIDYRYTETGNAERNLAFESFFHTDCDIGGPNFVVDDREYEMMVWIANPDIRTPGSTKAESGVMIDNQLWDVWIKPLQDESYIAFTALNEVTSGTLNWKRFVDWTVEWSAANQLVYDVDALDTNWCMAAIEFGVETWWGASRLQLDELKITRQ